MRLFSSAISDYSVSCKETVWVERTQSCRVACRVILQYKFSLPLCSRRRAFWLVEDLLIRLVSLIPNAPHYSKMPIDIVVNLDQYGRIRDIATSPTYRQANTLFSLVVQDLDLLLEGKWNTYSFEIDVRYL